VNDYEPKGRKVERRVHVTETTKAIKNILARAKTDESFRRALLADCEACLRDEGLSDVVGELAIESLKKLKGTDLESITLGDIDQLATRITVTVASTIQGNVD